MNHARMRRRRGQLLEKSNATSSQHRAAPRTMRRHVGGPFTPPRRASSGSYPDSRAGARRAPTSSSDDAGAAVKASVGGPSDLDGEDGEERTPADASERDDDARASSRDVDIGAREEPGERVRVLDDERADADSETDAHEDAHEDREDHATSGDRQCSGDDDDEEEERTEEESASDGGDSLADHSSADASLNALDPDNLRVLQSYGLRPQMSYGSSENDTGSDDNLLDDGVLLDDDDGHVAAGSAPSAPLPPTWRAAISASLRLSREFSGLARRSDESSSEEEDEDDGGVTFPWSARSSLDDTLNASTRAAAHEMLRAADVSHEVASLFASRVPRGVATSWEDARRGIDLDAVCAERFGGGDESVDPTPSTRAFEPPCDRSFGFSDDAACIAEAAAASTAFCPRKPRARAARAFADVSFVADLLEELPGVDPADARIACVLAAVTVEHAEELQRGEGGHGRRRGRANRATAGSFPRVLAPAAGRGLGAMARRELAGGGGGGRGGGMGGRAGGTGGRAGGATSDETRESRDGRRNVGRSR